MKGGGIGYIREAPPPFDPPQILQELLDGTFKKLSLPLVRGARERFKRGAKPLSLKSIPFPLARGRG